MGEFGADHRRLSLWSWLSIWDNDSALALFLVAWTMPLEVFFASSIHFPQLSFSSSLLFDNLSQISSLASGVLVVTLPATLFFSFNPLTAQR